MISHSTADIALFDVLHEVPSSLALILAGQFLLESFPVLFDEFEFLLTGVLHPFVFALQ